MDFFKKKQLALKDSFAFKIFVFNSKSYPSFIILEGEVQYEAI